MQKINSESLIAKAVQPLKDSAVSQAEIWARKTIERVIKELAENDNDLNKAAPYPKGFSDYHFQLAKYKLFQRLTTWRSNGISPGFPIYADVNHAKCEKFIKDCREDAAVSYELYVHKLDTKIGAVIAATLEGTSVWWESFLNITKPDGTKERWKTKQIENVSKLGRYFPQWPTRKIVEKSVQKELNDFHKNYNKI